MGSIMAAHFFIYLKGYSFRKIGLPTVQQLIKFNQKADLNRAYSVALTGLVMLYPTQNYS